MINKLRNYLYLFKEKIQKSFIGKFFLLLFSFKNKIVRIIKSSIRLELIFVLLISFLFSVGGYIVLEHLELKSETESILIYNDKDLSENTYKIVKEIERENYLSRRITNKKIKDIFYKNKNEKDNVCLTDSDGNILVKTDNIKKDKVNINRVLKKINKNIYEDNYKNKSSEKLLVLYPVKIKDDINYLIYEGERNATLKEIVKNSNNQLVNLILSILIFIITFIILTFEKISYIKSLSKSINNIADGNLEYYVAEIGKDEISKIAKNINVVVREINSQIQSQKRSEKMKRELITNVSHDLRTPLTSVIGYIDILKDEQYSSKEEMNDYLNIISNKSKQIKILIEDLFEYNKLNNENIGLNKIEVNLSSFISQVAEEMRPYFEENSLEEVLSLPKEEIKLKIDPNKMVRAIENLLTNTIKYSYKPGKVIIGLYKYKQSITISIKNKGDNIPKEKLEKLFDRFYRLDESRSLNEGSSGLGLAITKSIIEKHGGRIWAECFENNIEFNIRFIVEE